MTTAAPRRSVLRAKLSPLACVLVGLVAMAGPHSVQSQSDDSLLEAPEPAPPDAEAAPEVPYAVTIEGVDDAALRQLLSDVSETVRMTDRPPPSLARLRRRAENDRPRLLDALRSEGYYGGAVTVAVNGDVQPAKVTFQVDPGPLYRLRTVAIEIEPPDPAIDVPSPADLGLVLGAPAVAQTVLDGQAALLARVRDQGYALAELGSLGAVVDHATQAMELTLRLTPGPLTRFGPITFEGLNAVEQDAVAKRLGWRQGELITPARLTEGRTALLDTGLFNAIRFNLADALDKDGQLPVTVALTERKHRSFGVGVRYRTDEGPGGSLSWEHRNFFGRGEQVGVEFDGSFIGLSLIGSFRKPDFGRRDQALVSQIRLAYDDTDAFENKSVGTRVGLERRLGEGMTVTAGVAFIAEDIKEAGASKSEQFGLVSLPMQFQWDRSDDLLDPSSGGRLSLDNEPFVDVFGNGLLFNKARLEYAHYFEVLQEPQIVLAGRTAVGSLVGESRADVPANLRFYAGGGGSVRGFGFQLAGPLNDDHDPIGGRSLLELSGEVRLRVTETIGVVAFVDAGTVYPSTVPDFSEQLRVGAGPGLRYFSPIGPLRLDVGFPLNPRDSDDLWQLYISIGQAF